MGNHLGFSTGTTGEIHQHRIIIRIDHFRTHKGWCLVPFSVPIMETFGYFTVFLCQRIDSNTHFNRWTISHCLCNLRGDIFIIGANDSLNRCSLIAIDDVIRRQHVCCRDGNSPNLTQSHHRKPPLIMSFQNQHDLISTPNTKA